MSESTFPFADQAEPAPVDDEPGGGDRGKLAVVGGVALGLALFAGGFLLLTGGDDAETDLAVPIRPPAAAAPAAEPEAVEVVPAALDQPIGYNPFKARYVAPEAAAASGGEVPAGTTTGTTTGITSVTSAGSSATGNGGTSTTITIKDDSTAGSSSSPEVVEVTEQTDSTDPGSPTGSSDPAPEPQPKTPPKLISLTSVDTAANQLTFEVLDRETGEADKGVETIIVKPGEVFATYFKLFGYGSLKDAGGEARNCADLLYGDARLKLCEGESYQAS